MLKKDINISIFFNGLRGQKVFESLLNIKYIKIKNVIISKKFLQNDILKNLRRKKIKFYFFEGLNLNNLISLHSRIDVGVVAGFPYIIKSKLINQTKFGFLNCHAGILPQYRGGSPLNWQLINNEKKFGISVIKLDSKIDSGNIICKKKFVLKKKYDINDLHNISNNNFPKLVKKSINKIVNGYQGKKQNNINASYFFQRTSKDSKINLKEDCFKNIKLMVRALQDPYPNVYFIHKRKKISINNIFLDEKKLTPGEVLIKKNVIYFGCKDKSAKSFIDLKMKRKFC